MNNKYTMTRRDYIFYDYLIFILFRSGIHVPGYLVVHIINFHEKWSIYSSNRKTDNHNYYKILNKTIPKFLRCVRCTKKVFCLLFIGDFFSELIWFKEVLQGRNLAEVLTQLYTLPPTKQGLPHTAPFHSK